jgi:endogenous inhibitor of DNA gyrase (YacG/DUF329 family)
MRCPICKHEFEQKGSYFPFCSERCKLIDLGRWLSGKYQIPVKPDDNEDAEEPTVMPPARHDRDDDD